eukprot:Rhum_TRINITY_DN9450_c0_g1::Rhum_TRINITY_DN9450_c0_g1_i1::g.33547::m.33547
MVNCSRGTPLERSVAAWLGGLEGMPNSACRRRGRLDGCLFGLLMQEVLRQGLPGYCALAESCRSVDDLQKKLGRDGLTAKVETPRERHARVARTLVDVNAKWACKSVCARSPRRVCFLVPGEPVEAHALPACMCPALNGRRGKILETASSGRIVVQLDGVASLVALKPANILLA